MTRLAVSSRHPTRRPRLESLEARFAPAAGALDATFGTSGSVITNLHPADWFVAIPGVASVLSDGSTLVAGRTFSPGAASGDWMLQRYDRAGNLDWSVATSFNSDDGQYESPTCMVVQGDKILVGGWTVNSEGGSIPALARYTLDGALDPTFGTGGKVVHVTHLNGAFQPISAIGVLPDGNIIVAVSGSPSQFRLFRFTNADVYRAKAPLAPAPPPATIFPSGCTNRSWRLPSVAPKSVRTVPPAPKVVSSTPAEE